MTRTITRLALAALLAAPAAMTAQTPTPEGTIITNTATVNWTDANGNTYAPATASATVTVGYLVAVDVQGTTPVIVASPSTANWQTFTVHNGGNGTDSVKKVSASIGAGGSVTGYRVNGTIYTDTASLNLALSGIAIAANTDLTVEVRYDIAGGQGGTPNGVTLYATSSRQSTGTGSSDSFTTVLNPAVASAVAVSPDINTYDRLPSNGTNYSQVFVVSNNGNATDNFTLTASTSSGLATTVSIVSVNGAAGTGSSVSIASGATANITVVYSVATLAAAGATDSLRLLATSNTDGTKSDYGAVQVRVVRAALAMTKEPYRDNQSVLIGASDRVLPNEYIQYKITVTNNGGGDASTVTITDPLAAALTYVSAAGDTPADWTITTPSGVVTAKLTSGPLAAGASRYIWVRVQVK